MAEQKEPVDKKDEAANEEPPQAEAPKAVQEAEEKEEPTPSLQDVMNMLLQYKAEINDTINDINDTINDVVEEAKEEPPEPEQKEAAVEEAKVEASVVTNGVVAEDKKKSFESFELVLNVREIGSVLFELLDCIAMNSLIELNLVSLNSANKALTKEYRIQKYKAEINDRQIKTVTNLWNKNKNQLRFRTLNVTVPHKMSSTLDSLLEQVLDKEFGYAYSGKNLREIVRKNNENMDVSKLCKSVLDPQNYPLNHKFSFDNEICLKMILLTVAMQNVDSIFDIHGAVRRIIKQSNLNYNVIREVWYKRFIRQDLVDQFTRRKEVAPVQLRGLKHTFDTVFIGDEGSDEHDIRVMSAHLIKCNDIKNYDNEFAEMFSSEKMLECLENKKFGELILNEYCNNEDFKLNANILAIISDKVLCCMYMKDIIDEWYCFDVKCMQRGRFDYVNDMFSNNFYGVLSTCKVSEDEHESIFEIQFVEAVISYFCNYES